MESPLYLDRALIRPADVLLSAGRKPHSRAIARATAGKFSHAALVLNEHFLFEADQHGAGPIGLLVDLAVPDRGRWRLLTRLSDVAAAVVMRHPAADQTKDDETRERLAEIVQPFRYRQYSELARLVSALHRGGVIDSVAEAILRTIDKTQPDKTRRGPFCSELVAAVLGELGAPCFLDRRRPNEIAPNDLAQSALVEVPGAVCTVDPKSPHDLAHAELLNRALGKWAGRQRTGRETRTASDWEGLIERLRKSVD